MTEKNTAYKVGIIYTRPDCLPPLSLWTPESALEKEFELVKREELGIEASLKLAKNSSLHAIIVDQYLDSDPDSTGKFLNQIRYTANNYSENTRVILCGWCDDSLDNAALFDYDAYVIKKEWMIHCLSDITKELIEFDFSETLAKLANHSPRDYWQKWKPAEKIRMRNSK